MSEESGWKLVHGDVFRAPRNLVLLSALVGTGAQLAMLVLLVILLSIVGMLYVGYALLVYPLKSSGSERPQHDPFENQCALRLKLGFENFNCRILL